MLFTGQLQAKSGEDQLPNYKAAKVLFVGNSYTYWVEDVLNFIVQHPSYSESKFEYHTRGATPLAYFAEDETLHTKIEKGEFDYVVLQEWSLGVGGLSGNTKDFHSSVETLSKLIRKSGAAPVLYMTWGRDNTDPYDGFADMSKRVSAGYIEAAKLFDARADIRNPNEELGLELYEDGTHPSLKGQVLIAAAFFKALFNDRLEWGAAFSEHLTEKEWTLIEEAVSKRVKPLVALDK